jgi:hypothetical protein
MLKPASVSKLRLKFPQRTIQDFIVKPVAIFRHSPTEGPGYFATYLEVHSIDWKPVKIDAGEALPGSAGEQETTIISLPEELARAHAQGGGLRPSS